MNLRGTFFTSVLFVGDIIVFALSLIVTLMLRYGGSFERAQVADHFSAFVPLFALWLLIFYMAGLYGKNIVLFKSSVLRAIMQTQFINILLAALYFFIVPVGLAPKTNLILYLLVSLSLIVLWRFVIFPAISRPRHRDAWALIADGEDAKALLEEVEGTERYSYTFAVVFSSEEARLLKEELTERLQKARVTHMVIDSTRVSAKELGLDPRTYTLLEFEDVYEEVLDRIPLSLLADEWFIRNTYRTHSIFYKIAKRSIDVLGGALMALITLVLYIPIALLMRLEGRGPVLITQERLGKKGVTIRSYKFRSMRLSDDGKWKGEGENTVTRVGAVLRRTSLDEFPQCINVLKGELSLIGPRNDIRALGERLAEALPYYHERYRVTPGITGWAQINQQYEQGNISPQSVAETKVRLAYDFYYIKNQSLALDVVIALKTVKRMLFRVSSW